MVAFPFSCTIRRRGSAEWTLAAGPLSSNQESDQLVALVRRARRYFPPDSAQEVWDEIRPMLADTHNPDAFEVS